MYTIEHAGSSGTWRPLGEVFTARMAVAAARAVLSDGYDVRILWAGELFMTREQVETTFDSYGF